MATTIINSMSVKPFCIVLMGYSSSKRNRVIERIQRGARPPLADKCNRRANRAATNRKKCKFMDLDVSLQVATVPIEHIAPAAGRGLAEYAAQTDQNCHPAYSMPSFLTR
jgi:hypothetical protein